MKPACRARVRQVVHGRGLWFVVLAMSTRASAGPVRATLGLARERLEQNKDQAAAICAREAAVPRSVTVKVAASTDGLGAGHVDISADGTDAFAVCFAQEEMSRVNFGGFFAESFSGSASLSLETPERLFARALDDWFAQVDDCLPRPGATPRSVKLDITSDDQEMTVKAVTTPPNAAVEACMVESVRWSLGQAGFGAGAWRPTAHQIRRLEPLVTNARLLAELREEAPEGAASCIPQDVARSIDAGDEAAPRLPKMNVTVTAKEDAASFVVAARSGDATRDACAARAIAAGLHQRHERRVEGDEAYFRIDGHAAASYLFSIETDSQLEHRRDAELARRRRSEPTLGSGLKR